MDNVLNFKELIEKCEFEKLQEQLAAATKISIITVDYTGTPVTAHSRCSDFCNAVRSNPALRALCEKCDSRGGLEAARLRSPYIYRCHMGLIDFAIPIIQNNYYVGAVMCGQLRMDGDSARSYERVIAERSDEAGVPSGEFLYSKLPFVTPEDLNSTVEMISYVCNYRFSNILTSERSGQSSRKLTKSQMVLQPAVEYIDANFTKEIKLKDMADLCEISPSYFSKLFKKVTDENLVGYVNRLRVERAKDLLRQTGKSVNAVALDVGFEDCGYFIKVFKKITNLTPSAYRSSN